MIFKKHDKFANKTWKGVISEKNKNKNLLCWQGLVLLDWSWQVRTCPNHDYWSNLARFGSKTDFLTKFLDYSAWLSLEKLKKHVFFNKNFNIFWPRIQKMSQKHLKFLVFLGVPVALAWHHYGVLETSILASAMQSISFIQGVFAPEHTSALSNL